MGAFKHHLEEIELQNFTQIKLINMFLVQNQQVSFVQNYEPIFPGSRHVISKTGSSFWMMISFLKMAVN